MSFFYLVSRETNFFPVIKRLQLLLPRPTTNTMVFRAFPVELHKGPERHSVKNRDPHVKRYLCKDMLYLSKGRVGEFHKLGVTYLRNVLLATQGLTTLREIEDLTWGRGLLPFNPFLSLRQLFLLSQLAGASFLRSQLLRGAKENFSYDHYGT